MPRRDRKEARSARPPRSDVWTGLLALSCLAMLISCAFLLLEWYRYPGGKPRPASVASRR